MKNRKRGFSLVELLIVLAVIAALIATITPVALNAIRKSQATKVAQNMKTLASAFENAVYVNGKAPSLAEIGRDIDTSKYGISYTESNGRYTVEVLTSEEADSGTLTSVVANISVGPYTPTGVSKGGITSGVTFYYTFTFDNY